jgi:hypothetical protein
MTKTLITTAAALAMLSLALPAAAQTTKIDASASVRLGTRPQAGSTTPQSAAIEKAKARADQEIDRRVANLNQLLARINGMQKVDAAFKAALATTVQNQVQALTALRATVDGDQNVATLRPEIQSITKSYRIYALVMPQATIGAAADRVQNLAGMFQALGTKLQARIASSTASTSVAAAALADFNAKVADAQTQATAAVGHIAGLQPDNGNQTVKKSNDAALKQARADIRVAQQDFVAARKDADAIIKSLGGATPPPIHQ